MYRTNNNDCTNNNEANDEETSVKKPQILVDYLLNATGDEGKHFSANEIQDHVFTTISAVSRMCHCTGGFHVIGDITMVNDVT